MESNYSRSRAVYDRATVVVDFTIAAFSTLERKKRGKNERSTHNSVYAEGRRIQEISLALKQTFEEAIQTHLFPRSQIDISVFVLEQDGGAVR